MPRKPANPKNDTTKKTTRRKKTTEPVVETVADAGAETTVVSAPVEDAPVKKARKPRAKKAETTTSDAPKKRGRKPKNETTADAVTEGNVTVAEEAPVKKRGRKPKAAPTTDTTTDAPVKKRGRKKAATEIAAEAAPSVEDKPDAVVDAVDEPMPGQIAFDGEVAEESAPAETIPAETEPVDAPATVEESAPAEAPVPAKKRRGRPPKGDSTPKRRGRPPKKDAKPALVLTTTLQVGEDEFDISALAEKAYKDYKRVHKRKIVTDFHIYVKPEEGAAYFTVNGESAEDFKVELK